MADSIEVDLVARDAEFVASTNKAADAVRALADQEAKLGKAASDQGVDKKKFSQQFAKVEKDNQSAEKKALGTKAKAEATAAKAKEAAAKKAVAKKLADEKAISRTAEVAARKRLTNANQLTRVLLGRRAVIVGEVTGIGNAGVAVLALGAGFVLAGIAAAALLVTVEELALKADTAKTNVKEMLDTLTAGRGAEALVRLDTLAASLGEKVGDVREEFIKFRQAGLDNTQSANLIKLNADLLATGHSAAQAAEAVKIVLSHKGDSATQKQINYLAKQAGVVGDGTNAAAVAFNTLDGAINRIDNRKTKILEEIGDRTRPGIDKAATAIANLVDRIADSKEGQKAIDGLIDTINRFSNAVTRGADSVKDINDDIKDAKAIYHSFSDALDVIRLGLEPALLPFELFPNLAGIAGKAIETFVVSAGKFLSALPDNVETYVIKPMDGLGGQIIDGLVNGIEAGATKLFDKVKELGAGIKKAFSFELEIHSPSKVFDRYGMNIGQGAEQGIDRSLPTGKDIARKMLTQPVQARVVAEAAFGTEVAPRAQRIEQPAQAPIFGGAQGNGSSSPAPVHVTIQNISVPAGEDPDRWMRAAGREIGLGIQAILLGQGEPQ